MTTTRSKPLMILLITLLLIGLISILLIKPVVFSIFSSWKELKKSESNLQNADRFNQVISNLKSQNILQASENAKKFIPADQESGQLVIDITTIAQTNNLIVEQTTIDKSKQTTKTDETASTPTPKNTSAGQTSPSANSTAESIDFTMKLSGNFVDFSNFLKAAEFSSRLIVFKNISIQTEQKDDNKMTLGAQVSGSAYYKKDVTLENNLDNINVPQEAIEMFLNLRNTIQTSAQPSDGNFGRTNPFDGY